MGLVELNPVRGRAKEPGQVWRVRLGLVSQFFAHPGLVETIPVVRLNEKNLTQSYAVFRYFAKPLDSGGAELALLFIGHSDWDERFAGPNRITKMDYVATRWRLGL